MKSNIKEFEHEHWFFYTSTIFKFINIFQQKQYVEIILNSLKFFIEEKRIHLGAYVIMPNHIHLIIKTRNDHKIENINRDFKKFTAQQIIFQIKKDNPDLLKKFEVNKKDRKLQIWKRSPNLKNIISESFLFQKMNYIHNNPLQGKWNLAEKPEGYPYSSADFYLTDKPCSYFEIFNLVKHFSVNKES